MLKVFLKKISGPVIVALFFYLAIGCLYLAHYSWDLTSFMVFGQDNKISHFFANEKILIIDNNRGYDGQSFYFIARRPFDFKNIENVMDNPIYRYQRIVYPLLGHVLSSFGRHSLLLFILPGINLAAILLGIYFLTKILDFYRQNRWLSLFYGFSPGLIFTFLYNLPEPLAYLFIILAVYFFIKDKIKSSVGFLALAVLTKELCLFICFGFMIYFLLSRPRGYIKAAAMYFLPAAVFLLWWASLHLVFSSGSLVDSVSINLAGPFYGFLIKFKIILEELSLKKDIFSNFADIFFYAVFFASAIFAVIQMFCKYTFYNITASLLFVFSLTYSFPLVLFPKEYTRHLLGFFLFFLLALPPAKNRPQLILLSAYCFSSLFFLADIFIFGKLFR